VLDGHVACKRLYGNAIKVLFGKLYRSLVRIRHRWEDKTGLKETGLICIRLETICGLKHSNKSFEFHKIWKIV
jgi:hypothetical protein